MATKNRGLIKQKLGGGLIVADIPIPKLRDDYLLVRTVAVALNPADWQNAEGSSPINLLNGHYYAGIIEAVGKNVHKSFKKGDRVCGVAHGGMQPIIQTK
jgi:NADPH:quinone reductase-like Zn-dependent oxidoreductase